MIYRIVAYDRMTGRMRGSLMVPPSVSGKIKKIAGFKPKDDGLGEYPLDERQTRQVAQVLEFPPEPERFFYCVEPYEPPDDAGFRQETGNLD